MSKKITYIVLFLAIIELLILWWSFEITELDTVRYALAARWSARVSLALMVTLGIWIALKGLSDIFSVDQFWERFVLLVVGIAFNHLIHFVYLAVNHWVNEYNLFTLRSAGGALGYLLLLTAPFYLMNSRTLTRSVYWKVMAVVIFIHVVAIVGYIGRWNKDLPMASSKELYLTLMSIAALTLVMNVYRVIRDQFMKNAAS